MNGLDCALDLNYSKECCGEIYIVQKRYLVFHCCQCSEKYHELTEYLKHVCKHYVGYAEESEFWVKQEKGRTELTLYGRRDSPTIPDSSQSCSEPNDNEDELDTFSLKEETFLDASFEKAEDAEDMDDELECPDNEPKDIEVIENDTEDLEDEREAMEEEIEEVEENIEDIEDEIRAEGVSQFTDLDLESTIQLYNSKDEPAEEFTTLSDKKDIKERISSPTSLLKESDNHVKRRRRRRSSPPPKRKFDCEFCPESFSNINHLRVHIRSEHNTCKFCFKKFRIHSQMVYHQRLHTGEKPFLCPQCGRGFPTASRMSTHLRRHNNQRGHHCTKCELSFYNRRDLNEHMLVHTKERNFSCNVCSRSFGRFKTLQQHLKIHANLREYVCHICQQSFNQSPGLRGHLLKKHKLCNVVEEIAKLNNT